MRIIVFRRNLRNTLPKRLPDLLGGEPIAYGHHPWAGIFSSPKRARCNGSEHQVWVEDWRFEELKRQGVSFEDITAEEERRAEKIRLSREAAKGCPGKEGSFGYCMLCHQSMQYHE
jgi:hypothetical protein